MSTTFDSSPEELSLQPILATAQLPDPVATAGSELRAKLDHEIEVSLSLNNSPVVLGIVRPVLYEFLRLFGRLNLIESNLHKLDTLLESLSILELVQFEVRSLLDFVNDRLRTEGLSDKFREVLDGISYGLSHDVKRIFERELLGCAHSQSIPVVYGKILHAHGLLMNCFQQSTITLLQLLNPGLDALQLFNDTEERLRQSLALCNDLSSLLRIVRQAEVDPSQETQAAVVERIMEFRDTSMQFLMYRDWREFERLALAVITAVDSDREAKDLIHRFGCYLDVLYGHVKMRAVLRDIFVTAEDDQEQSAI